MVSGCSIAVTRVPSVSQCAEMQSTALGLGSDRATAAHARLNSVFSMAFIGLPWPMNRAGIVVPVSGAAANVRMMESVSYTHLRAHETVLDLVCRLLLEK